MVSAVQVWNPDDWEAFALSLLQSWHGTLNVHKIPAIHMGDFGIDYYCTKESVAYQCYSVQEPVDISARADRQKSKITKDLKKFIDRSGDIGNLFLGVPVKHWKLIVPLHDSKEVNLHCSKKTVETRSKNCPHLDANFEVGICDLKSFGGSTVAVAMAALTTLALSVPPPTSAELSQWKAGSPDLLANATHKLFKRAGASGVQNAVAEAVRAFLQGNAILDALRTGSPDLHEKVMATITGRTQRIGFAGPQGGPAPSGILNKEIDSLVLAIKAAAPNLSEVNAEQIAFGAVSEWIMRCPLDFPSNAT